MGRGARQAGNLSAGSRGFACCAVSGWTPTAALTGDDAIPDGRRPVAVPPLRSGLRTARRSPFHASSLEQIMRLDAVEIAAIDRAQSVTAGQRAATAGGVRDLNELNKYRVTDPKLLGFSAAGRGWNLRLVHHRLTHRRPDHGGDRDQWRRLLAALGACLSLAPKPGAELDRNVARASLCFNDHEVAMQLHVPLTDHINNHPNVLRGARARRHSAAAGCCLMKVSRAVIAHVPARRCAALDRDAPDSGRRSGAGRRRPRAGGHPAPRRSAETGASALLGLVERSTRAYFGVIDEAEHEV